MRSSPTTIPWKPLAKSNKMEFTAVYECQDVWKQSRTPKIATCSRARCQSNWFMRIKKTPDQNELGNRSIGNSPEGSRGGGRRDKQLKSLRCKYERHSLLSILEEFKSVANREQRRICCREIMTFHRIGRQIYVNRTKMCLNRCLSQSLVCCLCFFSSLHCLAWIFFFVGIASDCRYKQMRYDFHRTIFSTI